MRLVTSLKRPGKGKVPIKRLKINKTSIKHLYKKETFAGQKHSVIKKFSDTSEECEVCGLVPS